jgi:hypothetical protein
MTPGSLESRAIAAASGFKVSLSSLDFLNYAITKITKLVNAARPSLSILPETNPQ